MSKALSIPQTSEHRAFLVDLKQRIHTAQMRSALAANAALMGLYWYIGRSILALQQEKAWGCAVVKRLSLDLMNAYPGVSGFSRTNLFAMRQMVLFFDPDSEIVPQSVGQLPWSHIRVIMAKTKAVSNFKTALPKPQADLAQQTLEDLYLSDFLTLELDVEYALRDIHKPIGVSTFQFNEIPSNLQTQLPAVEEQEQELAGLEENYNK